ncbi:MAG: hypothetical protein ABIJ92_03030 [Candidatus Aenigmatarchaeota archaeon]
MKWAIHSAILTISGMFLTLGFIAVLGDAILGSIIFTLGLILFLVGYGGK